MYWNLEGTSVTHGVTPKLYNNIFSLNSIFKCILCYYVQLNAYIMHSLWNKPPSSSSQYIICMGATTMVLLQCIP